MNTQFTEKQILAKVEALHQQSKIKAIVSFLEALPMQSKTAVVLSQLARAYNNLYWEDSSTKMKNGFAKP